MKDTLKQIEEELKNRLSNGYAMEYPEVMELSLLSQIRDSYIIN